MQDFLIALLIGFIFGWLLEWLIDWQYWRSTVRALRQENEQLRRQLQGDAATAEPPVQAPNKRVPEKTKQPTTKDA